MLDDTAHRTVLGSGKWFDLHQNDCEIATTTQGSLPSRRATQGGRFTHRTLAHRTVQNTARLTPSCALGAIVRAKDREVRHGEAQQGRERAFGNR